MERSDDRPPAAYRVVLLHGHGDSPASMAPIAEALRQRTGAIVVTPAGPHRVAASGGTDARAWWPDDAEGPDGETIAGVLAAAPDDPTATNGPLAFVGFSQGGAMALAVAAAHQRGGRDARRATTDGSAGAMAVAVVSGFLPGDAVVPEGAAVLVVHGRDDTVVDPFHGELVARRCRRHGCVVDEQHHDGGHTWDDAVTALVARWLPR